MCKSMCIVVCKWNAVFNCLNKERRGGEGRWVRQDQRR